jgi:hypothetical protein
MTCEMPPDAACAREAELLRESGELLVRFRPDAPAPSAGFEARVLAATKTPARGRLVSFRPRIAAAAAAVLVAAAGAWWYSSSRGGADELTAREEEALAEDLVVISNLDALQESESPELAQLADDLDVIDAMSAAPDEDG